MRSSDPENGYVLSLEGDGDVFLYKYAAGSRSTLDSDTYTPAASVSVRLVVDGTDIDAYIDAWHKIDTADSTHAAGGVAFAGQQPKFDNLAIGYDENADGDLNDANDTKPVAETFASTSTSFTYDQAGNLVDDGSFRYTYDAWNRLVKATSATDTDVTFHVREYYGDGRWSKKTVTNAGQYKGAVVPYYDGWRMLATYDGSGNPYQQFVHGTQYIDELIMMRVADKGDFYVHQDANWNVIALTDLGGQVVERYSYTPYGELTVTQLTSFGDRDGDGDVDSTDKGTPGTTCAGTLTGACRILDLDFDGDYDASDATLFDALTQGVAKHPNQTASAVDMPFAHQGLYLDAELGTYQNRHRQYDPGQKRFLQRDNVSRVDGLHLYAYARVSPTSRLDPSGHESRSGGWAARANCEKVDDCAAPHGFRCDKVIQWNPDEEPGFPEGSCKRTCGEAHEREHFTQFNCIKRWVSGEECCKLSYKPAWLDEVDRECQAYIKQAECLNSCGNDGTLPQPEMDAYCALIRCLLIETCGVNGPPNPDYSAIKAHCAAHSGDAQYGGGCIGNWPDACQR